MEEPGPLGKMEGGGSGVGVGNRTKGCIWEPVDGHPFRFDLYVPPLASAPATPPRRRITV